MKHCFQLIVFSCSVRRNVHSFLSQPNNANGRLVMGRSARNAVRWRRGNGFNFVLSLRMWCSRKCWTTCANWFRSIVIEISRKIYGSKLWLTCSQLYCVVFYVSTFCPHLLSIEVPQGWALTGSHHKIITIECLRWRSRSRRRSDRAPLLPLGFGFGSELNGSRVEHCRFCFSSSPRGGEVSLAYSSTWRAAFPANEPKALKWNWLCRRWHYVLLTGNRQSFDK